MNDKEREDINFSIIIPAYNREKTVRRAIGSVLRQTYQRFEILVVDDGSLDNTREAILSMKDDRIRYIHQENQGAQVARNRGIKEAKNEWIAFLDSDDEWISDKLEKQLIELKKEQFNPLLVIHGNCVVKDEIQSREDCWNLARIEGANVFNDVLSTGGTMFQGMVTSKTALDKCGLLDSSVKAYQEWDTSIALARFCKFVTIHEPLFIYYLHESETISKDHLRDVEGYEYIIRKWRKEILSHCGLNVWNRHLFSLCERCIRFGFFNRFAKFYQERYGKELRIDRLVYDLQTRAKETGRVYCYGAGETGTLVQRLFEKLGIRMQCFVVSPGESTGMNGGVPVHSIDDIEQDRDCLVIISTREKLHDEIKDSLARYKFKNIFPVTDEVYLLINAYLQFGIRTV